LKKGYIVWGTSRDYQGSSLSNLEILGIKDSVKMLSMIPEDFRSVLTAINESQPDELYFLAGQSSVGLSFSQPTETIQSFVLGTLNILEACRFLKVDTRVYNAGSSECFGDSEGEAVNENTPFKPQSPYAVAKVSSFWLVNNYRNAYGLYACTGLLFNHESPLRPSRFVTQKICHTVVRIKNGSDEKLFLGRLDISRDWGWAPEYVEAMWLMLQQEKPKDVIIATGKTFSLEDFVSESFRYVGLDWRNHVVQSEDFMRPSELKISRADPSLAYSELGWRAESTMPDIIGRMIDSITNQSPLS
jgi:GDPmannose 4,6-dehydratase